MKMKLGMIFFLLALSIGCGPQQTILPTTELTEQQKKEIQLEDQRIADEESQGSIGKKPKKKS